MSFRTLLLPLLALITLIAPANALDVLSARYGRDDRWLDVRDAVQAHLRNNKLSFRVTKDSMGGDRNPGKTNYFYIDYYVRGQKYSDRIKEGDVFTFKGISGVVSDRPFLGIIQPPAPSVGTLRINNTTRSTVLVYAVDRYGRWGWEGELPGGRTFSATAAVGQQWRVTSRSNEELETFSIRPGLNSISVAPPRPPVPAGPVRLRFDNSFRDVLYVYKLDRWNNWEWISRLDAGASYSVDGVSGENWVVIDRNGRTVRQFEVAPGMSVVRCGP